MVHDVKEFDNYQIKWNGIISDYDQKIIIRLYQPLIGAIATMVYLTLLNEANLHQIVAEKRAHQRLFQIMQVDKKTFVTAVKKLEGIGLLNTFIKENSNQISFDYLYALNSPKSPKQFFQDTILSNLLLQCLGEDEYHRSQCFYLDNPILDEEYIDISSTYEDSFPNLEKKAITNLSASFSSWKTADVASNYHFDSLIAKCKEQFIPKYVFTEAIQKELLRLKLLFELEENELVFCIKESCLMVDGKKKIDIIKLNQIAEHFLHSTSNQDDQQIAKRLDEQNPLEFYRVLLDIPSLFKQDILLINDFLKMNIAPGVINAVLQYCVQNNQSKYKNINNYISKVMSSAVKAKCKDAYQTMLFLRGNNSKKIEPEKEVTSTNEKEISVDELLKIIGD